MIQEIQNRDSELQSMLSDMKSAPPEYRPTHYWAKYENESLNYIKARGIKNFRSRKNTRWRAFGAVDDAFIEAAEPITSRLGRITSHPLARVGRKIPFLNSKIRFLDKTYKIVRNSMSYHENHLKMLLELCYHYCSNLDANKLLDKISDSGLGDPGIVIDIEDRKYTLHFLRHFLQYLYIAKFVDFNKINNVLEIGGGYGGLAEVILKIHPHLKYINIDIPPQIYIAQQYLEACFPNSLSRYSEYKDSNEIYFKGDKKIITLCPWQLPKIQENFDLFINSNSFQEMEPEVVKNYANEIQKRTPKYVYIRAIRDGMREAKEKNEGGVLKKITHEHYSEYFDQFKLIDERVAEFLPNLPKNFNRYYDFMFINNKNA